MNPQILQIIVSQFAGPLLAGFVMLARMQSPTGSDADIAAQAEGDVRHSLRQKLGFLVDVLWSITEFKSLLDAEVSAAVAENTLPSALTALLPASLVPLSPPASLAAPVKPAPAENSVLTPGEPLELNSSGFFTQGGSPS